MDRTAGCCYFLHGGVSLLGPLLEQSRPLTRLLIRKGSLPGVAPLGSFGGTTLEIPPGARNPARPVDLRPGGR